MKNEFADLISGHIESEIDETYELPFDDQLLPLEKFNIASSEVAAKGVILPEPTELPKLINYAVVAGDPFQGLTLYGPFDHFDKANEWGEINCTREAYWVIIMHPPEAE